MKDWELFLYYTEFQQWVPDVEWHQIPKLEILKKDGSKNSKSHCIIAIFQRTIHNLSSCIQNNTHRVIFKQLKGYANDGQQGQRNLKSITILHSSETALVETVVSYNGKVSIDLSVVKGNKVMQKEWYY